MDISEAINDAVGTVLTEQEAFAVADEPEPEALDAASDDEVEEEVEASAEETEEQEAEEVDGDTYVAVPTISDKLAAEFTLFDAEGELEIPDIMVSYKANGQVRKDRLDQIVRLAQWGVTNHDRYEKTKSLEENAQAAAHERDELAQMLAERESQLVRLLQEDEYYYNARDAYESENSPENRAERAEQRVRDMQISQEMTLINNEGSKFWESELEPAIGMIANALPTVTADELAERCVIGIQPFMELAPNGQPYIPANKFEMVRGYILEDLAYWAKIKHEQRSESSKSTVDAKTALQKLEKARVEAQKAKRLVGQKTKPVGRAEKSGPPRKRGNPATLDDALDSALDSVLSRL
jgi:hypothetical protein